MTFKRLAALAGAGVLALGMAACSSTGGAPEGSEGGSGGGTVDTPRKTVAMITHEVPGDSFWDLVRKGAEAAAQKDNIELRYSNDPEAPNQANLVQSAIDSGVDGIAVTLAKPDAMRAAVERANAAGIPVVAFNAGMDSWEAMVRSGWCRRATGYPTLPSREGVKSAGGAVNRRKMRRARSRGGARRRSARG